MTQTNRYKLSPIGFDVKFLADNLILGQPTPNIEPLTIQMTVTEIPETIRVDLYELGPLGDQLMTEILIPIPDQSETFNTPDSPFKELDFSGTPFSLNSSSIKSETTGHWYTGKLALGCYWGVDKDGNSLGPRKS